MLHNIVSDSVEMMADTACMSLQRRVSWGEGNDSRIDAGWIPAEGSGECDGEPHYQSAAVTNCGEWKLTNTFTALSTHS